MKPIYVFRFFKRLGILFGFLQLCGMVSLTTASGQSTALLTAFSGRVEVLLPDQAFWIPAELNMVLREGDNIQTNSRSTATLQLEGQEIEKL